MNIEDRDLPPFKWRAAQDAHGYWTVRHPALPIAVASRDMARAIRAAVKLAPPAKSP